MIPSQDKSASFWILFSEQNHLHFQPEYDKLDWLPLLSIIEPLVEVKKLE